MRVVFMGTPALAANVLQHIIGKHEVIGVFTRPDAVRGRGKKLVASPVKRVAVEHGTPVYTADSFANGEALEILTQLSPDALCVAAYGVILPKAVLDLPRFGCFNVHTSLLPRWRGAAPIERAILAGDTHSGVCIMRMEEDLDTGPYCLREDVCISSMDAAQVESTLSEIGGCLLVKALDAAESDSLVWIPQSAEGVTYARKINKSELNVTPTDNASAIVRKVRASSPAHPSRGLIEGKSLTFEHARLVEDSPDALEGMLLEPGQATYTAKRLFLRAADGYVELTRLKPDGKKSMDAVSFASGIQGAKSRVLTWGIQ